MLKILRMIFTVLSAICLMLTLLLGTWLGGGWAVLSLVAALVFFGLMLLCKNAVEKKEEAEKPKQPTFFDPTTNANGEGTDENARTDGQKKP